MAAAESCRDSPGRIGSIGGVGGVEVYAGLRLGKCRVICYGRLQEITAKPYPGSGIRRLEVDQVEGRLAKRFGQAYVDIKCDLLLNLSISNTKAHGYAQ